ncbi:hypothetical protein [Thermomonas alba]|uniref:hypothetical protein n=1 Tax=Thermomonas alba TaxID=2888525 RepID=UPI001F03721B|nr:hypothetical protein [Thermomonas alba]
MKHLKILLPFTLALALLGACSDSEVNIQEVRAIAVSSEFKSRNDLKVNVRAQTFGEYANFDRSCSTHAPLIGAVHYQRKLKYLGEGNVKAKIEISGDREDCLLRLIGIHVALVSRSSEKLAWAAAFYNERNLSGEEMFYCYTSVGGPGYCLLKSEKSEDQRGQNRERLIGTVNIKWQ